MASAAGAQVGHGGFIQRYCVDCHDADTEKADLDLTSLSSDLNDTATLATWIEVADAVSSGGMPPKKAKQRPTAKEQRAFVTALEKRLQAVAAMPRSESGRGRLRRLNRIEFETALSDLLGLPLHIRELLPADARKDGFTTVGEALTLSATQMEAYLDVLDLVLDLATVRVPKPKTQTWLMSYKQTHGFLQQYRREGPHTPVEDGMAMFGTELFAHFDATLGQFTVPHDGRYRVRVRARTIRSEEPVTLTVRAGGKGRKESNHVPRWDLTHQSIRPGEPQTIEWEGSLLRGHFFHIYPSSLPRMRFVDGQQNKQSEYKGPGVVVQWVEVEGPIHEAWPPKSHELLWGDARLVSIPGAINNIDVNAHLAKPPDRPIRPWTLWDPKKKTWVQKDPEPGKEEFAYIRVKVPPPLTPELTLAVDDPKGKATQLLTRFIPRAFRREAGTEDIQPIIDVAHRWIDEGSGFESAMRAAYKLALTSPGFLYHQGGLPGGLEKKGRLIDAAMAERLSFFLWNSIPDERLAKAAGDGKLNEPETLRAEVDRLLDDFRSERFVNDFLDQWLDLRLIDFTAPDSDLYPEYDRLLRWSLLEETRSFFREMLAKDLAAANIADSDFTMLNDRLAKHYGIKGVRGFHMRRVALGPQSMRGGLMTHGSVLKVTANGSTTSPVVRGVWTMDRIIGDPAEPPPPGALAIEPDIRGATTIREQLEKHRADPKCAGCHAHFDPVGYALESFDVMGQQRGRYRVLDPKKRDVIVRYFSHRPSPIKYIQGAKVETADRLEDGFQFTDIRELKRHFAANPEGLARNLVERLIVYSTGASLTYADRAAVNEILEKTRAKGFGLRSLLHEVVQSDLFRMK